MLQFRSQDPPKLDEAVTQRDDIGCKGTGGHIFLKFGHATHPGNKQVNPKWRPKTWADIASVIRPDPYVNSRGVGIPRK